MIVIFWFLRTYDKSVTIATWRLYDPVDIVDFYDEDFSKTSGAYPDSQCKRKSSL